MALAARRVIRESGAHGHEAPMPDCVLVKEKFMTAVRLAQRNNASGKGRNNFEQTGRKVSAAL